MRRAAAAIGLVLLGAVTSVAGVAVHHSGWFPVAVGTPLVSAYAASPGLARTSFTGGWLLVLALAVLGRPEGDYVLSVSWQGYGLLITGLLLLGFAVATLPRPRPRASWDQRPS